MDQETCLLALVDLVVKRHVVSLVTQVLLCPSLLTAASLLLGSMRVSLVLTQLPTGIHLKLCLLIVGKQYQTHGYTRNSGVSSIWLVREKTIFTSEMSYSSSVFNTEPQSIHP